MECPRRFVKQVKSETKVLSVANTDHRKFGCRYASFFGPPMCGLAGRKLGGMDKAVGFTVCNIVLFARDFLK
jgi:hypothetical protein